MIILIPTTKYGSTYYNTFTMGVCSNYHGYFFQWAIIFFGPCECIREELLQTEPCALVCTWRLIRFRKSISDRTIVDGLTGSNIVNSAFGIILAVGQSPLLKRTVRYAE